MDIEAISPKRQPLPVTVRTAMPGDAAGLAMLCAQAGCRVEVADVVERLQHIMQRGGGMVLVAASDDTTILGLLHVAPHYSLAAPPQADIRGLIVDVDSRRACVGRALLGIAEVWARDRGMSLMQMHSNLLRDHADRFLGTLGYTHSCEQHLYRKTLA